MDVRGAKAGVRFAVVLRLPDGAKGRDQNSGAGLSQQTAQTRVCGGRADLDARGRNYERDGERRHDRSAATQHWRSPD